MLLTVSQLNRYVKNLLENDAVLCEVQAEGEISNYKEHGSGHRYFSLKDAGAAISCCMFAGNAAGLAFAPKNGQHVKAYVRVSLYEKTGQYQFYISYMQPAGEGHLQAAFRALKEKLQREGLFDAARKRAVPPWVQCVGLITSPTGAVVQDMVRVIRQRNPAVQMALFPAQVQGEGAAESIAQAISQANALALAGGKVAPQLLIVGRGGGSMEDLWAFNEETTARAIAASVLPVISAVGHETDVTIADFAADLRAPTPTAAAVLAVPPAADWASKVVSLHQRATRAINATLSQHRARWAAVVSRPCLTRPMDAVVMRQMHLQSLEQSLHRLSLSCVQQAQARVAAQHNLLEKMSPYALWQRGYAYVQDQHQNSVHSMAGLTPGQPLSICWEDGHALVEILQLEETAWQKNPKK